MISIGLSEDGTCVNLIVSDEENATRILTGLPPDLARLYATLLAQCADAIDTPTALK